MCIAIKKPKGKILKKEVLRNCFNSNRDGAGFAYWHEEYGEVCVQKGFFEFDKFMEAFEPFQDLETIIHFRVATHRLVNGHNCHPWRVNDNLVFIHNGMISGMSKNGELSDTGNFNDSILKPLVEKYPDIYLSKEFHWFIENAIGSGNKLIFLDAAGRTVLVNEKAGEWEEDVWFSNKSYAGGYGINAIKDVFVRPAVIKDKEEETSETEQSEELEEIVVTASKDEPEEELGVILDAKTQALLDNPDEFEQAKDDVKALALRDDVIETDSLDDLDKVLEERNAAKFAV